MEYTLKNLTGVKVWQTAVSSKLAIEDGVKKVLCEYSKAKISKIEILEGLTTAYVKFITKLVYINSQGDIKSKTFEIEIETGSEFADSTLESKLVFSSVKVLDEEFTLGGENDAKADAVLEISIYLTKPEKVCSCSEKGEDTFLKTEEHVVSTFSSGEYRVEVSSDVKVKDDIREILLTESRSVVKSIENRKGVLVADGEVYTRICYLTNDEVPMFRTAYCVNDFTEEVISCGEESFDIAHANCEVLTSSCMVNEKEVAVKVELKINYVVFEKTTINLTTDAYSTKNKIKLNYGSQLVSKIGEVLNFKDEVSADVKLTALEENKVKINSVIEKDINVANYYIKDGELTVEGLAGFTVFYDEISIDLETKTLRSVDSTVPFSLKFKTSVEIYDKLICEINFKNADAKLTRDEAKINCDVEVAVVVITKEALAYLESTNETSETYEEPASISLYVANDGDNLWSISKKLKLDPEMLLSQNKELENEIYSGQQVVVYRQRQ